ncbi:hypothetical protein HZP83_08495 [Elizabethkingia anophelis]|nr:hypothetical protein [Elizabethkingia anophelis]MCT4090935.1 hypothetical protein [Elizabethkingia anophelis]
MMEKFIKKIEDATGLTFKKSFSGSGSYYCNERRIRISDHFSKYTEKMLDLFGDENALDLVFRHEEFDLDFALKMINKDDFFKKLNINTAIEHVRHDLVGDIQYVSHSAKDGYVEVLKKNDNTKVKYDFSKINIK